MESLNGKMIPIAAAKKTETEGRPVAVDWALSKEKWEETQQSGKKADDIEETAEQDNASISSSSDNEVTNASGSNGELDEDEDRDNEHVELDKKSEGIIDEDIPAKPKLPSVDVGSTLFIRNLPFETTEAELNLL